MVVSISRKVAELIGLKVKSMTRERKVRGLCIFRLVKKHIVHVSGDAPTFGTSEDYWARRRSSTRTVQHTQGRHNRVPHCRGEGVHQLQHLPLTGGDLRD